jgi:hypothetical protein
VTEHLGSLPYWQLRFDAQGDVDVVLRDRFLSELPEADLTDLFVFSHGWNNNPAAAARLYEEFFGHAERLLDRLPGSRVGVAGVVWPSMAWLDEPIPDFEEGGAVALAAAPVSDGDEVTALKAVFSTPEQQRALDEMGRLLEDRPDDPMALQNFHKQLGTLVTADPVDGAAVEDDGETALLSEDPTEAYGRFQAAQELLLAGGGAGTNDAQAAALGFTRSQLIDEGGAAGFSDVTGRLWSGAKTALRQATYFVMKRRAGAVGQRGLGPILGAAHEAAPAGRFHLIGHSFGARVVSFALAGLPDGAGPSPVKSLLLLQGAFSHFAFASELPHDRARGGALAGRAENVDGPLVCCFSEHDTAVGVLYPLASFGSREDAAGTKELGYRWGAMGHDGAQAVGAVESPIGPVGKEYPFARRRFLNVDASDVVRQGRPLSGAHSDIFHPELAWIAVSAARFSTSDAGAAASGTDQPTAAARARARTAPGAGEGR